MGEMAEKERAQKAKERAKKEKTTKLKEKADKEKKSKEQATKEKTAKAKEKAAKEKASKERAAKIAAEKAAKEKASKVAAERASKERTKKVTVTYHAWTGWINNMDHPVNYVRGANTNLYLSGLYGMHSNYYEDRQFKVINTRIGSTVDRVSQTGYVNNMDQAFAYSCPANMAIIGLASYHQNWYEDRRWKITCGHFKGTNVQAFGWPGAYQTKQDAVFNLNCGSNPMIGIGAAHSNWYEDRVFRIRCGKLVLRA